MEETRTGGKKEFLFSCLWAVLLLFIGRFLIFALPEVKVIGAVVTLLMFCVLGFFVLTRYSAVYTYSLKNNRFRVNRKIGHRNKEYEVSLSGVKSVTKKRPPHSPRAQNMRATVFSEKNVRYILYRQNKRDMLLVCTISDTMAEKLKNSIKHAK